MGLLGCAERGDDRERREREGDPLLVARAGQEREEGDAGRASSPAKNSQRETTLPADGPVASAASAGAGAGRSAPTPNAITPDSRCPSSR